MEFVLGQSSRHWERLRVSSYRGFFLFPQRIDKVGVSFQTTPMGIITYTHSPRTGVDSSRHTHGSESSTIVQGLVQDLNVFHTHGVWLSWQNLTTADAFMTQWVFSFTTTNRYIPKGITSRIRTQSLRTGVHDAVGCPFLPRQTDEYPRVLHHAFAPKVYGLVYMTQMNTHGYYITHLHPKSTEWCTWRSGFSFFTTTNRWLPTDITSRICTQSLRTGVHDVDEYPRVLHHAFAPKDYGLVYMTQWVFLFYHDKQTNTHGYLTYTGLIFPDHKKGLVSNTHHGKKHLLKTCTHDRMIGGKAAKRSNSGATAKKTTFLDETNHAAVSLTPKEDDWSLWVSTLAPQIPHHSSHSNENGVFCNDHYRQRTK